MLRYYKDNARFLCHAVKENNYESILQMAFEIVQMYDIPQKSILVPAPQHTGRAIYTLALANRIAELTGAVVKDILHCRPHDSLYYARKYNKDSSLELYTSQMIDQEKNIFFVDNVICTGKTFLAAQKALNKQIQPLVYAVNDELEMTLCKLK